MRLTKTYDPVTLFAIAPLQYHHFSYTTSLRCLLNSIFFAFHALFAVDAAFTSNPTIYTASLRCLLHSIFFAFRVLLAVDAAPASYPTTLHHDHRTDNTTNYAYQLISLH